MSSTQLSGAKLSEMIRVTPTPGTAFPTFAYPGFGVGLPR